MTRRGRGSRSRAVARIAVAVGVLCLVACGAAGGAPGAADGDSASTARRVCDRVARVSGSDTTPGTLARPLRTIRRLLAVLRPGQTGCLVGGTYVENVSITRGGRQNARVTLRSAPGTRARVEGYVLFRSSASYVTLSDLNIDGANAAPNTVQVQGDHVTLHNLDITNDNKPGERYNGICVLAGPGFEREPVNTAYNLIVEGSRIHNCGDDGHEHALYLESTRDAIVRGNYLYDNPGYGISMYPDAQRTLVIRNVIDGNGHGNITFSGEKAGKEYRQDHASSNNRVTLNVIANAQSRYNIESFFPALKPVGNLVEANCVWNAPWGNFGYTNGYSRRDNIEADPEYVDRGEKDFRLRPSSPCRAMGPRVVP